MKNIQDIAFSIDNKNIVYSFLKAAQVVNSYQNPYCSISGGRDSDIMLDIIYRVDKDKRVKYVWFDTGLEYQATKNHLVYLEDRYNIKIERIRAEKPIPAAVREYGQPFLSKFVSEILGRLQRHGFDWEVDNNKNYDSLVKIYPNCKGGCSWWTNNRDVSKYGYSMFNINYNKYLKEFIIENPPNFKISNKCCYYAKKKLGKKYAKENKNDLSIIGVRKNEGGIRAAKYKNCYTNEGELHQYRPIFYYTEKDRSEYDSLFKLKHSDCYEVYGMTRTGCAGCPFNRKLNEEMAIIEKYEPKLAKAVKNIFKDSYEYTRKYRDFVNHIKNKTK